MNGTEEDVMYDKVPTDLKFVEREKEVEKFWEAEHIFEKSIKMSAGFTVPQIGIAAAKISG